MSLGVCTVKLRLPENHSLKDKRKVLKSITTRVRNRYNVAIAEMDDQDLGKLYRWAEEVGGEVIEE